MNPKDLLDPEKMKELENETEKLRNLGIKEDIKNNKPKENFSGLNKLGQAGSLENFGKEGVDEELRIEDWEGQES